MNRKEAIRILGETNLCSPLGNAAFTAIQDLKKQIPEEVIVDADRDKAYVNYICPDCKKALQSQAKDAPHTAAAMWKHCPNCGKALKWKSVLHLRITCKLDGSMQSIRWQHGGCKIASRIS